MSEPDYDFEPRPPGCLPMIWGLVWRVALVAVIVAEIFALVINPLLQWKSENDDAMSDLQKRVEQLEKAKP